MGAVPPAAPDKPTPVQREAAASVPSTTAALPKEGRPSDPATIWQKTLTAISKAEPPLFGLLRGERFLGAEGNIYQLQIPFSKKDFSYMKLSQSPRKDIVSQFLSEAAGEPSVFQPVLESDLTHAKKEAVSDQVQSMLVETFGRDLVQIDDEEEPR